MKYNYCPKCGIEYQPQQVAGKFICAGCDYVFYLNSKPTASVIIEENGKILLGKRKINPSKDKWDIIGGFLEVAEHPEEGAKREVREETGLKIKIESTLGFFMDTYGPDKETTLNICFIGRKIAGDLLPGDDIKELQWFFVDEIPNNLAFNNTRAMLSAWSRLKDL